MSMLVRDHRTIFVARSRKDLHRIQMKAIGYNKKHGNAFDCSSGLGGAGFWGGDFCVESKTFKRAE